MFSIKYFHTCLLCSALIVASLASAAGPEQSPKKQDGQHDFDFNFGSWKTHVSRVVHPLTASTEWAEYDGTSVVTKVWNGRASLFELNVSGPAGHVEGVGLRLYNPETHQWSLNLGEQQRRRNQQTDDW